MNLGPIISLRQYFFYKVLLRLRLVDSFYFSDNVAYPSQPRVATLNLVAKTKESKAESLDTAEGLQKHLNESLITTRVEGTSVWIAFPWDVSVQIFRSKSGALYEHRKLSASNFRKGTLIITVYGRLGVER